LQALPAPFPVPIVIVQHIEPGHVQAFADWLKTTGHDTMVVSSSENPRPGFVYVAPSHRHLRLDSSSTLVARKGEPRGFQRPSVDELFESLVSLESARIFAVLLSGMGDDGATGLARLAQAGAQTAVQRRESCVVPGMPSAALSLFEGHLELTPEEIAETARRLFVGFPESDTKGTYEAR
jgi:two-component system chemotaxis response regulator CheB